MYRLVIRVNVSHEQDYKKNKKKKQHNNKIKLTHRRFAVSLGSVQRAVRLSKSLTALLSYSKCVRVHARAFLYSLGV